MRGFAPIVNRAFRDFDINPVKGRKPAFAPLSEEDAEAEIQHLVGRDPVGIHPYETRWDAAHPRHIRVLAQRSLHTNGISDAAAARYQL